MEPKIIEYREANVYIETTHSLEFKHEYLKGDKHDPLHVNCIFKKKMSNRDCLSFLEENSNRIIDETKAYIREVEFYDDFEIKFHDFYLAGIYQNNLGEKLNGRFKMIIHCIPNDKVN